MTRARRPHAAFLDGLLGKEPPSSPAVEFAVEDGPVGTPNGQPTNPGLTLTGTGPWRTFTPGRNSAPGTWFDAIVADPAGHRLDEHGRRLDALEALVAALLPGSPEAAVLMNLMTGVVEAENRALREMIRLNQRLADAEAQIAILKTDLAVKRFGGTGE